MLIYIIFISPFFSFVFILLYYHCRLPSFDLLCIGLASSTYIGNFKGPSKGNPIVMFISMKIRHCRKLGRRSYVESKYQKTKKQKRITSEQLERTYHACILTLVHRERSTVNGNSESVKSIFQ